MARNVEIKARLEDPDACTARIAALGLCAGATDFIQDDTFFRCQSGRLKLRATPAGAAELIYYRRADRHGPKESFYVRTPTREPDSLRECLSLAYGEAGRVVKHRTVFIAGRTRIHLDRVEGLGHFLELEVVLDDGEGTEAGAREARELMDKLGIEPHQLIAEAYVDLLERR